jgi:molybdopterin molybdotransferase
MAQLSDDCFRPGSDMMPLLDALELLTTRVGPVASTETVPLTQARSRILAADVVSDMNVPPHDNSAVDGYGFRHADLTVNESTEFEIVGRAAAGHPVDTSGNWSLAPRATVRVFTGAPVPPGCDTVVMQEDIEDLGNNKVAIPPGLKKGANRRSAGEDIRVGNRVLTCGQRLRPQHLGVAASIGCTQLSVYAPLRVAIFSTGDEVVDPGSPLPPGGIYDANRIMVTALCAELGAEVDDLGILPDQADTIRSALESAAADHDLIITSGGVSVGDEDHVKGAVEALGQLHFWRLAIKPGRPIALGQVAGVPFAGLPGNPVAAMVTFLRIVRPVVLSLAGSTDLTPKSFQVRASFAYAKKVGRREMIRARIETDESGTPTAHRYKEQGAGILSSITASHGLVELPEDQAEVALGDLVDFFPFSEVNS